MTVTTSFYSGFNSFTCFDYKQDHESDRMVLQSEWLFSRLHSIPVLIHPSLDGKVLITLLVWKSVLVILIDVIQVAYIVGIDIFIHVPFYSGFNRSTLTLFQKGKQ
jgi:hypothetical protein